MRKHLAFLVAALLASASAAQAAEKLETLARRLDGQDVSARIEAAQALCDRAPDVEPVLPDLVKALKNEYWEVRVTAMEALRKVGAKAVPALAKALGDKHYWSRVYAARTLGRIGPEASGAMEALGRALSDGSIDVRREAAGALAEIGGTAPVADALVGALDDGNEGVRQAVVAALGKAGPAPAPGLVKLMRSDDAGVAQGAALALAAIGPEAGDQAALAMVGYLKREIEDTRRLYGAMEDGGIRQSRIRGAVRGSVAIDAVGRMGPAAAAPTAALLEGADDIAALFVMEALGRLGPAAVDALPAVVVIYHRDPDPWQRARAAGVMGNVGAGREDVLEELAKGLSDAEEPVRRYSAYSLGALGEPGIDRLIEALNSGSADVRVAACQGLERAEGTAAKARPALERAAKDKDEKVAGAAAGALRAIGE